MFVIVFCLISAFKWSLLRSIPIKHRGQVLNALLCIWEVLGSSPRAAAVSFFFGFPTPR
jgi:hypothetical protein